MRAELFGENTWLYPDKDPEEYRPNALYLARGGHTGVQICTDAQGNAGILKAELPEGVDAQWYQMLPVRVERNSAPKTLTTLNYEEVRSFVTRRAPFDVYDMMEEIPNPRHADLQEGPIVLFVRFAASADAKPAQAKVRLILNVGEDSAELMIPPSCSRGFHTNRPGKRIFHQQLVELCRDRGTISYGNRQRAI